MIITCDKIMELEKLPSNEIRSSINFEMVIKFSALSHNKMASFRPHYIWWNTKNNCTIVNNIEVKFCKDWKIDLHGEALYNEQQRNRHNWNLTAFIEGK